MHVSRNLALFACYALMLAAAPPLWAAGLFGMTEIKANTPSSIPKWVDVLARIRAEDLFGHCMSQVACGDKRADWYEMVQQNGNESREAQMTAVNRWVNSYPYITDDQLWGRSDYWETPGQFVDKSGDCEDYAITKYYSLKRLGWPERDLRLVVVHDAVRDIPHAVLAVKLDGETYILDNLASDPLPDRYVTQYTPYYAVNADSRWVFIKPYQ